MGPSLADSAPSLIQCLPTECEIDWLFRRFARCWSTFSLGKSTLNFSICQACFDSIIRFTCNVSAVARRRSRVSQWFGFLRIGSSSHSNHTNVKLDGWTWARIKPHLSSALPWFHVRCVAPSRFQGQQGVSRISARVRARASSREAFAQ